MLMLDSFIMLADFFCIFYRLQYKRVFEGGGEYRGVDCIKLW